MAKQSGLGMQFYIDGYTVGGDVQSVDRIAGPRGTLDFTDITKFAFERKLSTLDGGIDFTAFFNPDAVSTPPGIHTALKTLPSTDRIVTAAIPSATSLAIGDPAACIVAKQINYDGTREASGGFTLKVATQANGYGLEWGQLLTAGTRADTTGTTGSSLDLGTGTVSFGLQAWLHVISFTGTSCTVKLQGSSDNGAGDAFADITGGGFTAAAAAPQAQRIATATNLAVERYIRAVTTGTFTQCSFVLVVNRNPLAPTF